MCEDHGRFQAQQVSKRVCRNLTAEFCSSEASASSEPNLDLWVLRTLGLKDRDTIDTSLDSSSSSGHSLRSLVYDSSTSMPSSVYSCYQSSSCQTQHRPGPAISPQCGFTATGLSGQYDPPGLQFRSCNTLTAFESSPESQEPNRATVCSTTALSRAQTPQEEPSDPLAYWSPGQELSPPGERVHFSPVLSSSPVTNQACTLAGPSGEPQPPAAPRVSSCRTDLAFSMSLSPSSSVKTHSFPQGQAFVRKDNGGRWNFTWVPRQGP